MGVSWLLRPGGDWGAGPFLVALVSVETLQKNSRRKKAPSSACGPWPRESLTWKVISACPPPTSGCKLINLLHLFLQVAQMSLVIKNPPANAGEVRDAGSILGWEDPLEKEVAAHSRILAWRIPWTEEPGGLQPMGSQESDTAECTHTRLSLLSLSGSSAPLLGR